MKKSLALTLAVLLGLACHANPVPTDGHATTETLEIDATPAVPQNIPANPHNPANGTYLRSIMPDDSELSKANTELLAKNTELTRQVDSLTTQVNVLVQEKSGQLLIYGGIIALFGFVLGFIFAKLTTRQRW